MQKVLAIVQARMSSERLPGKVLREVMGKPLIEYMFERLKPSQTIKKFVLATSTDKSDDALEQWCLRRAIPLYRGNLIDVLDRFYRCVESRDFVPDVVVRLTGDCPLHHYSIVDFAVREYHNLGVDFFSNSTPESLEDGFDVEVFSRQLLLRAWKMSVAGSGREHVTTFMRNDPAVKRAFAKFRPQYSLKLSVDRPEEFELIRSILENLYPVNPTFTIDEIVNFLQKVNRIS